MPLPIRVALLALLLAACSDAADDSAGDTDTDTDTELETGGPDVLVTTFQVAVVGGALSQLSHGEDTLPNTFTVALIDSASWTGWDDEDHMCAVVHVVDGAAPASAWDDGLGGWSLAWDVQPSMRSEIIGSCDGLDAQTFGDDVGSWVDALTWAFAFSSELDPDIESGVAEKLGAEFDPLAQSIIGAWTGTDLTGSFGFEQVNYGVVYAAGDDGRLIVDGADFVYEDTHSSDQSPDGYYYASAWYGWPL